MGSPLLAVTGLTVDVRVWAVAGNDGVEGLCAIAAFEALAMPLTALSQDLFSSVDDTATTWATLAGWRLDHRSIDYRCFRSLVPKRNVLLQFVFI